MLNFTLAISVPYAVRYMNKLQLANYGIKNQKIEFQTPSAVFFHSCLAGLQISVWLWRSAWLWNNYTGIRVFILLQNVGQVNVCKSNRVWYITSKYHIWFLFKSFFYRILFCIKPSFNCDIVQDNASRINRSLTNMC